MDVVVKENIANIPMKNHPYVLGVVDVPDSHYSPVLYTHNDATIKYQQLNHDLYEEQKKVTPQNAKKTPVSVLCALGIFVLSAIGFTIKHSIKK